MLWVLWGGCKQFSFPRRGKYFWYLSSTIFSDEDDAGVEESLQSEVASLQDRVEELEEELAMETRRGG